MPTIQKRTSASGKVSYRVLIRLKGFPAQTATFPDDHLAKKWGTLTEAAIWEGRYFKSAAAKKHTLEDMVMRYLKSLETSNPRRLQDVAPMMAWWKQELGYCILADLDEAIISEALDRLATRQITRRGTKAPLSPARINRYYAALFRACSLAVDTWKWLEKHPMVGIERFAEPEGRVRWLEPAERAALLKATCESKNEILNTVVVLALSTGARKSEIMGLQWKDVDLENRVLVFLKTKNKRRRSVALAGQALEKVQKLNAARLKHTIAPAGTDLVFPSPNDPAKPYDINTSYENAVKLAGLNDFHFHDLRHCAASYMAMNGATVSDIAAVLGHQTLSMAQRYSHLSPAHTRSVVISMNEKIFGGLE